MRIWTVTCCQLAITDLQVPQAGIFWSRYFQNMQLFFLWCDNSYGHPDPDTIENWSRLRHRFSEQICRAILLRYQTVRRSPGIMYQATGKYCNAADFVSVKRRTEWPQAVLWRAWPGNQIQVLNRDDNGWATIVFNVLLHIFRLLTWVTLIHRRWHRLLQPSR